LGFITNNFKQLSNGKEHQKIIPPHAHFMGYTENQTQDTLKGFNGSLGNYEQ
jgi:hypothetical protein